MSEDIREHIGKNKERQVELRRIQLDRDQDRSFGNEYKNPCKKEREMSYDCIQMSRFDPQLKCDHYFENYKTCKMFWNAVQHYRCMYMKKRKHDYPKDDEYEKWKRKLPEWLETKNLTPPDDL